MLTPVKKLILFPENPSVPSCDPFFFEDQVRKAGYGLIAGVDEAGRGPLAGPVVAAAVIVREGEQLDGIQDSKKMTARAREKAFPVILHQSVATGIGVVSHKYIDEFNILNASLEAMRQAVLALNIQVEFLLVDGIYEVPLQVPQWCLKKGDQLSRSISAASVLAKVYRDRIMRSYHEMYPQFGFDQNKGYGTSRHLAALRKYGKSPLHRVSFKGVLTRDKRKA